MAIAEREITRAVDVIEEYPPEGQPRLWTHEEYYQMAEVGILKPGERTELIQGRIVQKMSPMGSPHMTALSKTAYVLGEVFGSSCLVRTQGPMTMPDGAEPEPDVLVVQGTPDDYEDAHPGPLNALLLVEISDATYRYDQGLKADIYAAAGITEYWVINLRQRALEVRRNPLNGKYGSLETYSELETVSPHSTPNATLKVANLLPLAKNKG